MSPVKSDMHQLMNEIPSLAHVVLGQNLQTGSISAQEIVPN